MGKCNQMNCDGELVQRTSQYGPYWRCSICGHIIDGRCKRCGDKNVLTTYDDSSVARCTRCGRYDYGE